MRKKLSVSQLSTSKEGEKILLEKNNDFGGDGGHVSYFHIHNGVLLVSFYDYL